MYERRPNRTQLRQEPGEKLTQGFTRGEASSIHVADWLGEMASASPVKVFLLAVLLALPINLTFFSVVYAPIMFFIAGGMVPWTEDASHAHGGFGPTGGMWSDHVRHVSHDAAKTRLSLTQTLDAQMLDAQTLDVLAGTASNGTGPNVSGSNVSTAPPREHHNHSEPEMTCGDPVFANMDLRTDVPGHSIRDIGKVQDHGNCCKLCADYGGGGVCRFYTHHSGWCWLKESESKGDYPCSRDGSGLPLVPYPGRTAGCVHSAPAAAASARRQRRQCSAAFVAAMRTWAECTSLFLGH